jgi:hypothetical protein
MTLPLKKAPRLRRPCSPGDLARGASTAVAHAISGTVTRNGPAWDWAETETGTRHSPGIQPADVEELVAHGATTVVLSQGMNKQLHVPPDTCRYLEERSITVHVAEASEAVRIYNDLSEGVLVAGLFHSTC